MAKTSMLKSAGLSFFLSMTLIATASPVRRSTARHTEPVPPLARHDLKSYSASTWSGLGVGLGVGVGVGVGLGLG